MCGIAGLIGGSAFSPDEARQQLASMLELGAHRGPDGRGTAFGHGIALGHLRLAIVDLSPAGAQPMSWPSREDDRFVITYNGEIYNHVELRTELEGLGYHFRSQTDTEVILASYEEWGPACLHRFNGMWAFAIWDKQNSRLFLARDRFGVKPLHYWNAPDGTLAFASEIKQFTGLPGWSAKMNGQAAYEFLNWTLTNHSDQTFFEGVRSLLPGHFIEIPLPVSDHPIRSMSAYINQWYRLKPQLSDESSIEKVVNNLGDLLSDSVRLRLRSDVPVGSCLSGGLDSSLIVSLVNSHFRSSGHTNAQHTFSSVYPGETIDESSAIAETVKLLGLENHTVVPSEAAFADQLTKLVWHQDEPIASASPFAQWELFKLAKENGIKVMLDGQGADELFAGYHSFFGPHLLGMLHAGSFVGFFKELIAIRSNHGYAFHTLVGKCLNHAVPRRLRSFGRRITGRPTETQDWLNHDFLGATPRDPWKDSGQNLGSTSGFSEGLLSSLNLQMLLRFEDRDSMAHSVEARVPYLDYRLVEFGLGLSDDLKIRNGITKWILRESSKGRIPESIRQNRRKLAFETPQDRWLARSGSIVRAEVEKTLSASIPYIDNSFRQELIRSIEDGRPHALTFRIYALEKWREVFAVSL